MNTGMKITVIIAAAFVLLCCGGGMLVLSQVTDSIDKRAKDAATFGDLATKQILQNYDAKRLVSLASPQYSQSFNVEEFQEVLNGNKKALGSYRDGKGTARLTRAKVEDEKTRIRMNYTNAAEFERGQANVVIELSFQDKKWQIEKFSIEPR